MKQRALLCVLTLLFCVVWGNLQAFAKDVTLQLNSVAVQTDVPPCIIQDRTMIPVRALFEELGAEILWDNSSRKVNISYNNTEIVLTINDKTALVNGTKKVMDVPATILQDRTLIPVRFIAENLGFEVSWDPNTYIVNVIEPKNEPTVTYQYYLTQVTTASYSDKTVVTVQGVSKASASTMTLSSPTRLVFDFKDTKLSAATTTIQCNDAFLSSVRLGQFDPTTARVVLDISASKYNYTTEKDGDNFIITVYGTAALPSTDGKRIVFIDPGHGGSEVGAVGNLIESAGHTGSLLDKMEEASTTQKTIYEKDINLDISLKVNKLLQAAGIETCMLRTTDTYINIYDRPKIANNANAYLYLSIHNNASTSTSVSGTQVYYSDSCPSYAQMTNKELANIYYEAITQATGLRKAGVIDNPRYIVINQTNMPALILEVAFMSNQSDLKNLINSSFTDKVAQGIYNATVQVLETTK